MVSYLIGNWYIVISYDGDMGMEHIVIYNNVVWNAIILHVVLHDRT